MTTPFNAESEFRSRFPDASDDTRTTVLTIARRIDEDVLVHGHSLQDIRNTAEQPGGYWLKCALTSGCCRSVAVEMFNRANPWDTNASYQASAREVDHLVYEHGLSLADVLAVKTDIWHDPRVLWPFSRAVAEAFWAPMAA